MDNFHGIPPPPGVQSSPNFVSPTSSIPSAQHYGNVLRPHDQFFQHHMNHQLPVPPYATQLPHGQAFPPHVGPPSQFCTPSYGQFPAQIPNNYQYGNGLPQPMPAYQPPQQLIPSNFHGTPHNMIQLPQPGTGVSDPASEPLHVGNFENVMHGIPANEHKEKMQDDRTNVVQSEAVNSDPSNVHSTAILNSQIEALQGTPLVDNEQNPVDTEKIASGEDQIPYHQIGSHYPPHSQKLDDEIESAAQAAMLQNCHPKDFSKPERGQRN